MPWYSSWLPGLPSINFALPSSLQGRFISFILKKSLGHLLKPGQLDSRQIDSQIGSGYVQVNDVELDNETINELIPDLPIFLHDGYISSVTARIPWPNPLTSTIGFSLSGLRLTFHVHPLASTEPRHTDASLSGSVASMAESFVHDELTSPEEVKFRESFHPNLIPIKGDPTVPGALDVDPFVSAPEDEALHLDDVDPTGVSMFTALIERLLARFEFEAHNTEITLVDPGNMSLTMTIAGIQYQTEISSETTPEGPDARIISISGTTVITRNLRPPNPGCSVSGDVTPHISQESFSAASPTSSTSSIDEETQFGMSQSLASLPPQSISPTGSDSSMYQSALSTAPVFPDKHCDPSLQSSRTPYSNSCANTTTSAMNFSPNREEDMISFGLTPIVLRLTARYPARGKAEVHSPPKLSGHSKDESLHLSVTCGVIALALHGWHICGLLNLANNWTSRFSIGNRTAHTSPDAGLPAPTATELDFAVSLHVRGVVLLLLSPPPMVELPSESIRPLLLLDYFKHPLVPPILPQDYLRVHFDTVSGSVSQKFVRLVKGVTANPTNLLSMGLSINDVSVFSYSTPSSPQPLSSALFSPILITDRGLPSQYRGGHIHPRLGEDNGPYPTLPTFETIDWTDSNNQQTGVKLSPWRSIPTGKPKSGEPRGLAAHLAPPEIRPSDFEGHPTLDSSFAMRIRFTKHKPLPFHREEGSVDELEVNLVPMQLFLDLGLALRPGFWAFMNAIEESSHHSLETGEQEPDTETETEIEMEAEIETGLSSLPTRTSAEERRRLERLVFEDLGLGYDYVHKERNTRGPKHHNARPSGLKATIHLDLVRLQIRCPPPLGRHARSGALLIDLHNIKVATGALQPKRVTRFSGVESRPELPGDSFLVTVDLNRIVLGCSLVHERRVTSVMSLGSLGDLEDAAVKLGSGQPPLTRLEPRITFNTLTPISKQSSSVAVISIDIPSVGINTSKRVLDALQYWLDDATLLTELLSRGGGAETNTEKASNRDASLIGSRFFAKSRNGSGNSSMFKTNSKQTSEIVCKISVSEAFVQIMLPRLKHDSFPRPFIVSASDIDALIEVKPEGRDETTMNLTVMDLSIHNVTPNITELFLSLTSSRGLSSTPRPLIKLQFTSLVVPETIAKESRIKLTLSGFTYTIFPDISWASDLAAFVKSPPGTFESVIPSERTRVFISVVDVSIRVFSPRHPGAFIIHVGDSNFSTDVVGGSPDSSFQISVHTLALLFLDNSSDYEGDSEAHTTGHGVTVWKTRGYALLAEFANIALALKYKNDTSTSNTRIIIEHAGLNIHLCADSLAAVTEFTGSFKPPPPLPEERPPKPRRQPTLVSKEPTTSLGIMGSIEDLAFKRMPEVGPAPDLINDDLPTNLDYLDESFGTAAGLRELRDDDLNDFDDEDLEYKITAPTANFDGTGVVSRVGGETIRILRPEGIQIKEGHFDTLPPDTVLTPANLGETLSLRIHKADITLFLYEGYDWSRTRKIIEEEVKDMRRRLAKIRQLVASGQTQDPSAEETSTLLFNSLYIGLEQDIDGLEPGALIAAIDEELQDDIGTASQSSWQSLRPPMSSKPKLRSPRVHGKRLSRSKGPSMEFRLFGLEAEVDHYLPDEQLVSRTFITVSDLEILDHIKTSTWKKFLTELRSDSHGNVRETDSAMVRIELSTVRPVPGHSSEEARLRAKILPLRLYVDQDAVDFLKKFFNFKDPHTVPGSDAQDEDEMYFQLAEVFPVDLKLDYKPRRVDYRALREGKTIELMNFFHFDGAEMTLRHITLSGITGWSRLFELLNDLWTPDVKATQLVEVISGVAPIRSVVNVGSGIADLVLLPIAQYKKDGRIVRGVQKGTTAFVKSTAIEAIKLGARLATGTQVILEQAESVLGGSHTVTAEPVQGGLHDGTLTQEEFDGSDDESTDAISKYAQQPIDLKEGMQSAYKSLQRNLNSAAQTILAVPMEVYERSGNEGPVRSVIRAVPIAVLRPMIGASEAVSQTLLGLHNTLDPNIRHENEAKYKRHQ